MTLQVHLDGFDQIQKRLLALPESIGRAGLAAASSYLVGVLVNREVPPYKYIGRDRIPWASDKQRRFVMASIRRGEIEVPYHRLGKGVSIRESQDVAVTGIQAGWKIDASNPGRRVSISSTKAYAKWLYGSDQAKRAGLIGWKKMTRILLEYQKNIVQAFERGVKAAIKKAGLQ